LAACLSNSPVYGQKPTKSAPKREVTDVTPVSQPTPSGSYYALIIGIDNYQDPVPKLKTAVNDATALAKLLREQYGFKEIKLLLDANANRTQILLAINDYKRLPADSNVLIYYAGHGSKDPKTQRAYWLPVDAQRDSDVNWIGASTITDEISGLQSQHVLVIADSCYSGGLTRDSGSGLTVSLFDRKIYLRRMQESPSRTLMASGRDEPVADRGKDDHSVFAYSLLESLRIIPEDQFTAGDLFHKYIQQAVAGGIGSNQVPQYGIIQNSGHEFGDFVFARSGKAPVVVVDIGKHDTPPDSGAVVPPPVSTEPDRYAANQVVSAYADSYNRMDAASLWKIWPGAPKGTKQAIQSAFGSAGSITMKITEREIDVTGNHAKVMAQFAQEYTPRNGSPQKLSGPIALELEKKNGTWVIASIK
jgi:ketosteroid isomerase-like protein